MVDGCPIFETDLLVEEIVTGGPERALVCRGNDCADTAGIDLKVKDTWRCLSSIRRATTNYGSTGSPGSR
jgi:hypothetical protein